MDHSDINLLFTEKVTEYLAKGYQINLDTMRGAQGEIAKVDLCQGTELIRILLVQDGRCMPYDNGEELYNDRFLIQVGRSTVPTRGGWSKTVWRQDLEIISEIEIARMADDYFTTIEKSQAAAKVRMARWRQHNKLPHEEPLGEAFKPIALRWLRKQPRMKTCKLEEVESVSRIHKNRYWDALPDNLGYEIKAKGRTFLLRFPDAKEKR